MISVYALADARTGTVRYVGQTRFTPEERLRRHLKDARGGNRLPRNRWIRSLLRAGLAPQILLLETARTKKQADRFEISASLKGHEQSLATRLKRTRSVRRAWREWLTADTLNGDVGSNGNGTYRAFP